MLSSVAEQLGGKGLVGRLSAVPVLVLAVASCVFNAQIRAQEARLAQFVSSGLLGTRAWWPGRDVFFFDLGTAQPHGLAVSFSCSIALLWVPLAVIGAAVLGFGRGHPRQVLPSLAMAGALLVLVNLVRLVVIVGCTHEWGSNGFGWAHTLIGSLIALAGLAATMFLFLRRVSRTGGRVEQSHGPGRVSP